VQYSLKQDSAETIAQVREHNAAYGALCPANACKIDQTATVSIRKAQAAQP